MKMFNSSSRRISLNLVHGARILKTTKLLSKLNRKDRHGVKAQIMTSAQILPGHPLAEMTRLAKCFNFRTKLKMTTVWI